MNTLGAGLGRFVMEAHEDRTTGIHCSSWLAASVPDTIWTKLGRLQVKDEPKLVPANLAFIA